MVSPPFFSKKMVLIPHLISLDYALYYSSYCKTVLSRVWIWIRDLSFFTWLIVEPQDVC